MTQDKPMKCPSCGKPMPRTMTILGWGWYCYECGILAVAMRLPKSLTDEGKETVRR